jgi:hypothetical protein
MMRFLARLSLRARPALSRAPALMPKGLAMRQPVPVFRAEEPVEEEEQAHPLRRAAARPIRRAEEPPAEEQETQRTSAPTAGEEDEQEQPAMARRVPGSLRRAEKTEEEEPAQPLRRAAAPAPDEEESAQAARLIHRAEEVPLEEGEKPLRQPFQQDLSPGASPLPPDMANEEEPPAMQALRRDIASFAPPPAAIPTAADPGSTGFGVEPAEPFPAKFGGEETYIPGPSAGFEARFTGPVMEPVGGSDAGASAPQRPQVIIDQVDVLIHEPAAPAVSARPAFDAGRAMRARYLRRL